MERLLNLLLDEQLVNSFFYWLGFIGPVLGLGFGWCWGVLADKKHNYLIRGLAIGCLGPIILGLWLGYNAIVDALGLDTVKNLLVNLALFVVVGIILGLFYRFVFDRTR
ncbi:hypothetical protein JXQ70_07015 [bacterium]|nr:hypothetical protein [bacterium]